MPPWLDDAVHDGQEEDLAATPEELTANLHAFYAADRNAPGAPVSCTKLLLSDDYDLGHPAAAADFQFVSTSAAPVSAVRNVPVPRVNARALLASLQSSQA